LGSPHPLRPRRFRRDSRYPPFAVRRLLSQSASSPRELCSSSESSVFASANGISTASAFLGVRGPSSRCHRPASMPRGSQSPLPFRPQRFSRSRRLSPPSGLWVYFTPQPRPEFALQGFSLARSHVDSSSTTCPPVVGAATLTMLPPSPRHVVSPTGLVCRSRIRRRRAGC
jgi:hypothetical protein